MFNINKKVGQELADKFRPGKMKNTGARHKPSWANITGGLKVTKDMRYLPTQEYVNRVVVEINIKANIGKKPPNKSYKVQVRDGKNGINHWHKEHQMV